MTIIFTNDVQFANEDVEEAYNFLNQVRENPKHFSKALDVNLDNVKHQKRLQWNNILAKVAQEKAEDMAKRKYFDHVDPDGNGINIKIHQAGYRLDNYLIKNRKNNYFESLAAGDDNGIEAIKSLIIDEGIPDKGHRKHLLGMNKFWAECEEVGIGFVRTTNAKYPTYTVVIIAKHK